MTAADHAGFLRVVRAVKPYLHQLVFVGAWSHRLQQFHPLATAPAFTPLMTDDADVATPERLEAMTTSLGMALVAGGFQARLSGDGRLPVTRYHPRGDEHGLYVEFIAPLRGSGYTRDGASDDMLEVAGITAQKLRYVDLLLFEPWHLPLTEQRGFDAEPDELSIRVANPVSYLAQKVLTLQRRTNRTKRSKDVLYIHDTLAMFGSELDGLRAQGVRVLGCLPATTRRGFHDLRVEMFQDESLVVGAADIAAATGRASPPSADTIAAVCAFGLERIFDP